MGINKGVITTPVQTEDGISLELNNVQGQTQIASGKEMIEVPIVIRSILPCKEIQDSVGFWIPRRMDSQQAICTMTLFNLLLQPESFLFFLCIRKQNPEGS